jgi:hypothetical protein
MEPVFILLIAAAAVGLIVWNASRVRRFENAYRHDDGFGGTHYETPLGLPNSEAKIQCLAGADQSALYLLKGPPSRSSMWQLFQHRPTFRYSLRIPWQDIECRTASMFFKPCIWFDLPSKKIHFYLAADIGQRLLTDAGRKSPP